MKQGFWRRLRFLLRGSSLPGRTTRVPIRSLALGASAGGDGLLQALLELRSTVEAGRLEQLPLAWFRVDEAKAAADWYDPAREPSHAAVLAEEEALAERLLSRTTGRAPTFASLLRPGDDPLPMIRYRLLVARLPLVCATGGRRAEEAVRCAYELMARSPDVLSPYGRWLLARAVCLAARDREELRRQAERFHLVTADHRAADGASMMFVAGGDFELPLPVSVTEVLDWRGMPTRIEAIKKGDAPQEIVRFYLRLTPRSQRVFYQAFCRRQNAYLGGYPWRKPHGLSSEGYVFHKTRIHLPAFFIDRRPVTNDQYQAFAHTERRWLPSRISRYAADRDTYLPTWNGDMPATGTGPEPVTGVSYQACRAYAVTFGKRLPSEAQWVYALLGREVSESRHLAADSRPTMSDEERAIWGRRAAERGLHILLPERLYDFDGPTPFAAQFDRVITDPRGPQVGSAHLWRSPTARGRVPDLACDANLTFRGVIPASLIWAGPR